MLVLQKHVNDYTVVMIYTTSHKGPVRGWRLMPEDTRPIASRTKGILISEHFVREPLSCPHLLEGTTNLKWTPKRSPLRMNFLQTGGWHWKGNSTLNETMIEVWWSFHSKQICERYLFCIAIFRLKNNYDESIRWRHFWKNCGKLLRLLFHLFKF